MYIVCRNKQLETWDINVLFKTNNSIALSYIYTYFMVFGIIPVSFLPQAQPELVNQHKKLGQRTRAPKNMRLYHLKGTWRLGYLRYIWWAMGYVPIGIYNGCN